MLKKRVRREREGGEGGFGRRMLLCCQQKHCFMYAVFSVVLQYCVSVWVQTCVCFLHWMYLALPVHRDELNLSKFCLCVCLCDVLRCIRPVYGHVDCLF